DFQTGTMHYGSPSGVATGSWEVLFDARVGGGFFPAPLPGSTHLGGALSRGVWNGIEWTTTPAAAQAGPLVPPVSMVRSPKIDDQDLFANRSGVGLTPTLSWTAPSTGTVGFYVVSVNTLAVVGTATVLQGGATLVTRNTSLQLPAGVLTAGVPTVISIAAISFTSDRTAALLADAPFKNSNDRAQAYLSSG